MGQDHFKLEDHTLNTCALLIQENSLSVIRVKIWKDFISRLFGILKDWLLVNRPSMRLAIFMNQYQQKP